MLVRPRKQTVICALTLLVLALVLAQRFGTFARPGTDPYAQYFNRSSVNIRATFRDFQHSGPNAHPDFGRTAPGGAGRYLNIAADDLDSDGKPAFRSTGNRVITPWTDLSSKTILSPRDYVTPRSGDHSGQADHAAGGAVTDAAGFARWYRDGSGATSSAAAVVLSRESSHYVFDGPLDHGGTVQSSTSAGTTPSCTTEMDTLFVYYRNGGWYVEATTDADVWVYLDGKLVIDGGSAAASGGSFPYSGIIVDGTIQFLSNAELKSATGATASAVTSSTASGAMNMGPGSRVTGNVVVGPGANVSSAIAMANNAAVTGTRTAAASAVTIPDINPAPDLGASVGNRSISSNTTLSTDLHCDALDIGNSRALTISGNRTIVCDGNFTLGISSRIEIQANSSLRLYVRGTMTVKSSSELNNNTRNPALVTIYSTGAQPVSIQSSSGCYANILAPGSSLALESSSALNGSFIGHSAVLRSNSTFTAVDSGAWVNGSGGTQQSSGVTHRIELDRLAWLTEQQTHRLQIFYADRDATPSRLRIETNITTLGVAALPGYVDLPD